MEQRKKEYTLKMYDAPLMDLGVAMDEFGRLSVSVSSVEESRKNLFPMLLLNPSPENARRWVDGRIIPKNRRFVDKILESAGLSIGDKIGILDVCKGLSVNDAYWLDDGLSEMRFADINLYDNELDETLALVAYTGYSSSQKHKIGLSTEWTTDGQFAKAWRRMDGQLYLFKAGSDGFANAGMEPYSEFFAAQIAECMGIPHVSYDLQQWKGKLASVCPLMNSKDISFVPFWIASGQSHFPSPLAAALAFSDEMFEQVRTMTVFDALIGNCDRHAANYGILRDNHTGRVLGLAPLFDHNLSLFARDMKEDFSHFLQRVDTVLAPATGHLTFKEEAEIVMGERQHEQLRKLLSFRLINHSLYPVPEDRLEALNIYLSARVRELLEIPVADETELRRRMKRERSRFEEPIAMLEC